MEKTITVSFPGLGIESFSLDNVAFTIPIGDGYPVMWYGVVIACGMLLAILYASWRCKQYKISFDDLIDVALFTIIFGVIGARLYYVAFEPENFKTFFDVIDIRSGGMAIPGGLIAGSITIIVCCIIKKINWRTLLDCVAPGVFIAQSLGRWGNFFNGEAYGALVEEGNPLYFIRMGLVSNYTIHEFGTSKMVYVHPTFLYESVWNICGFVIINLIFKKKKFEGQNALFYFAWYGFGRMLVEGLRTDYLPLGNTDIRVTQLLMFVVFVIATGLIVYGLIDASAKQKKLALAGVGTAVNEEGAESIEAEAEVEAIEAVETAKADTEAIEEKAEEESSEADDTKENG